LFLAGTARYAVRATFSGAAAGQNRAAGLEIHSARSARAGTSQRDVPTIFENSAWMSQRLKAKMRTKSGASLDILCFGDILKA
jgi:hypothetical protein